METWIVEKLIKLEKDIEHLKSNSVETPKSDDPKKIQPTRDYHITKVEVLRSDDYLESMSRNFNTPIKPECTIVREIDMLKNDYERYCVQKACSNVLNKELREVWMILSGEIRCKFSLMCTLNSIHEQLYYNSVALTQNGLTEERLKEINIEMSLLLQKKNCLNIMKVDQELD